MRRTAALLGAFALLQGCDSLQPDRSGLTRSDASVAQPVRCDLCHGNPPNTGSHRFHIDTVGMKGGGAPGIPVVSCISCHAASIAHAGASAVVLDTAFIDPDDASATPPAHHTAGWPWKAFDRSRFSFVSAVDSMVDPPLGSFQAGPGRDRPDWSVVGPVAPGMPGHMSGGRADVVFQKGVDWVERIRDLDGNVVDSVVHVATWNPVRMSCGMVACHNHRDPADPTSPDYDADTSTFYAWNKARRAQ